MKRYKQCFYENEYIPRIRQASALAVPLCISNAIETFQGRTPTKDCDNVGMIKDIDKRMDDEVPLLREENGELSLHFGFPTIQSRMQTSDPDRLVLDYTRTMMGFLLFVPAPERILMVGLGGGSLAKYCHRHLPQATFTTVELSSEVIALRSRFDIPADSERFSIVCADGADYLRTARTQDACTDVLLIDGFDRDGQPAQLSSAAFYDDCRAALRPGGVLVVNLCADDPARDDYLARIERSFSGRSLVVEADEGDNLIVFATTAGIFPPNFVSMTERLRQLEALHAVDLAATAQKMLSGSYRRKARENKAQRPNTISRRRS